MKISSVLLTYLSLKFFVAVLSRGGLQLIAINDFHATILKATPCIQEICNKYFKTGQPIGGSIILVSVNQHDPILQRKLLRLLNADVSYDWTLMIMNLKNELHHDSSEKAKSYLTIIDKSEDILEIINKWKSLSTWNPLAQVVILMANEMDSIDLQSGRRNLMVLLLQNRVMNAYIASVQENPSRIEVATLFPYEDGNCADQVMNISIMDNCEYDPEVDLDVERENIILWEVTNHYENKIPNDLNGCPIVASARLWEPYAVADKDGNDFNFGIDVKIVKTIAKKLNLDLLIVPQNGTVYEVQEDIGRGGVDLMIGGIDEDPSLSDYLSSTIPYYQDDLTWCVSKAGPSLAWMKIWAVFDELTWLSVLIFLIFSTAVIFKFQLAIQKKRKLVRSFLSSISMILNQPLMISKYTLSFRAVMFGFIIFGMILNVMYQSLLITTLTRPLSEAQIKEQRQLVEMQMRVYGSYEVSRHLDKKDTVQNYLRSNLESCPDLDECLLSLSYDGKKAVATSREHVAYNPRIRRENIYCFPILDNIYLYLVSVITVKHFHLMDKFNRIIRQISEAGFIQKWKAELDHSITLKEEMQKAQLIGPKPLTFNELFGIFILGSILLFVSFLVFLFELIAYQMARSRGTSSFWICIDQRLLSGKGKFTNNNRQGKKVDSLFHFTRKGGKELNRK